MPIISIITMAVEQTLQNEIDESKKWLVPENGIYPHI
jgi:hypothetical protein